MASGVDEQFAIALPKVELHAHLTGSISTECLHDLWLLKQGRGQCLDLADPLDVISRGSELSDVSSFFPIFDKYIYALVNEVDSVKLATESVLQDFQADGVVYLELRTTPRENVATGLTKEIYVAAVNDVLREWNRNLTCARSAVRPLLEARLILSVDRKMTSDQAREVVGLAIKYQCPLSEAYTSVGGSAILPKAHYIDGNNTTNSVVGVDLCGNTMKGDVGTFTDAFGRAKSNGLGITVHFAEVPASSTNKELETLLSWQPDRIGHVIHVRKAYREIIEQRKLGPELCLSCNVLAKLTLGGFAEHHFAHWRKTACPVAFSVGTPAKLLKYNLSLTEQQTDDVGIFGSQLSNEYLLAARHFGLGPRELVKLSRSAVSIAFTGRKRAGSLIDRFAERHLDEC